MKVQIDFGNSIRPMKSVHGVNNGPKTMHFMRDATPLFQRAGIPYSRLHDTEGTFGDGEFVDIPCIFKNFDADPEDPSNYNFLMTDEYIKAIRAAGTKVIYRLGVSIENGPIKKYIYPPKDYRQWARICEGIIRHYNEGWADGMIDEVEYYEIWNEPEFMNHMWIGSYEQFYELFKSSILYLKEKFPRVKIGGPATGYTSDEFTEGFFRYMTAEPRAPMDFFSFHTYFRCVEDVGRRMRYTRELLDANGYSDAEIFCTEWNYVLDWGDMEHAYPMIQGIEGAAFAAAALCQMQQSPCTGANYYDAQMRSSFNGLFKNVPLKHHDDPHGVEPRSTFFSFESYWKMVQLGTEVFSEADGQGVYTLAAGDGKKGTALLIRFDRLGPEEVSVELSVANAPSDRVSVSVLNGEEDQMQLRCIGPIPEQITLPRFSVVRLDW